MNPAPGHAPGTPGTPAESVAPVLLLRRESLFARWFPWVIAGLTLAYVVTLAIPAADPPGKMQIQEFAKLPIVYNGRLKPFDTLARTTLLQTSGRQTVQIPQRDAKGELVPGPDGEPPATHTEPAVRWLLDVLAGNPQSLDDPILRIENDQLIGALGLQVRPGLRYTLNELRSKIGMIAEQATAANKKETDQRDAYESAVLKLAEDLQLIMQLQSWQEPHAVPPTEPGGRWIALADAAQQAQAGGKVAPGAAALSAMAVAYGKHDAPAFNQWLAMYKTDLEAHLPQAVSAARVEAWYNGFGPFDLTGCLALYLFALLLMVFGWIGWSRPLSRAAVGVVVIAWLVHTVGILVRIWISGRPPVTNLYSSALLIGWGCVGLSLLLRVIYKRLTLITAVGAIAGLITMLVAFGLAKGDTMEVLQAVLDTRFWLATHVICVTLGYTATYFAGLFGIVYLVSGLFTNNLRDEQTRKTLTRIIYGVICFATLLSFTGTVLGGIWADQSWGRFWGWDPKENGALMIVLWNALILHARWAGLVKARGMAVLAVAGNIVTSWSWFGVNLLGVGLHSYGFMHGAAWWLILFVCSQLGLIALGLLPLRWWCSFRPLPEDSPPHAAAPA